MTKIKILIGIALGIIGTTGLYVHAHTKVLQKRFPDIDPKLVARAHHQILKEGVTGKLPDSSSEFLDKKLIDLVSEYQK